MPNDWQLARHMGRREYALAIHRLGMNKAQAGRYLGVSVRTAHRFWDGDTPVPVAVSLLLHSLIAHGEKPLVPGTRRRLATIAP